MVDPHFVGAHKYRHQKVIPSLSFGEDNFGFQNPGSRLKKNKNNPLVIPTYVRKKKKRGSAIFYYSNGSRSFRIEISFRPSRIYCNTYVD